MSMDYIVGFIEGILTKIDMAIYKIVFFVADAASHHIQPFQGKEQLRKLRIQTL